MTVIVGDDAIVTNDHVLVDNNFFIHGNDGVVANHGPVFNYKDGIIGKPAAIDACFPSKCDVVAQIDFRVPLHFGHAFEPQALANRFAPASKQRLAIEKRNQALDQAINRKMQPVKEPEKRQ